MTTHKAFTSNYIQGAGYAHILITSWEYGNEFAGETYVLFSVKTGEVIHLKNRFYYDSKGYSSLDSFVSSFCTEFTKEVILSDILIERISKVLGLDLIAPEIQLREVPLESKLCFLKIKHPKHIDSIKQYTHNGSFRSKIEYIEKDIVPKIEFLEIDISSN